MPRFNSINFDQNRPKLKLFLPKEYEILKRWGLRTQTPESALRIALFCPRA